MQSEICKLMSLGFLMSPQKRVQKKGIERGSLQGGIIAFLPVVSILLQGKMEQEQRKMGMLF